MKTIYYKLTLIVSTFILMVSCSSEGVVNDFGDMSILKDHLEEKYPNEDIGIQISNGYHLSVFFINSDLKELEKSEKEIVAKEVGEITRQFFDENRISSGTLTFFVRKNYLIFKYTNESDRYDLGISSPRDMN